jgi:hypothetical protein
MKYLRVNSKHGTNTTLSTPSKPKSSSLDPCAFWCTIDGSNGALAAADSGCIGAIVK